MKLLVCVLALVAAACAQQTLTEEQKANWRKWSEECKAETGVSQEAIEAVRTNRFEDVSDPKIAAHALCFSKKSGLANADGDILVEQIKVRLERITSPEEAERIATKCAVKKATPEQTALDTFKCVRQNRPKFSPV